MLYPGFASAYSLTITGSYYTGNQDSLPKTHLDERVLLNTDRIIYLCGEEIIFSAYTYEGNWFLPVSMSSVLYVELYSQDNRIISSGKFAMYGGRGNGKIAIPRNITSNIYHLRAYTNYMKNFGIQQFCVQKIKIVNPFYKKPVNNVASASRQIINCQIHPEGGNLIEGLLNNVGCRFTDSDGNGIQSIARLLDKNNNVISSFQTYKNGFAGFKFVPEPGNTYTIEAISINSQLIKKLPESAKTGLILSVDTITPESLSIRIVSNEKNIFPVRLIGRHGGFAYFLTDSLIVADGIFNIPLKKIPKGLVNLELSQPGGNQIASRLIYINPLEKFEIVLTPEKENFGNREKVNISVNTKDRKGLPVITDLILFAFLTNDVISNDQGAGPDDGILSQEFRQIYFNDEELLTNLASDKNLLNLVLLTTPGLCQKKSGNNDLKYLPEIDGDIITGKLVYKDNRPAIGIEVLQSYIGKTTWIESSVTDQNGNFRFLTNKHKNRGDLILKVQNSDRETSVQVDNEFFPDFPSPGKEILELSSDEIDLIKKQFINIQIADAFFIADKNKTVTTDTDTISFYGKDNIEYSFPDYVKLPNMKEFFIEVVLGAVVVRENKKDVIVVVDKNTNKQIGPHPLIIIDGVPVSESSVALNLNPEKVRRVRVVRYKYFYKDQIYDGIIDIITFTADAASFDLPVNTYRFNVLYPQDDNEVIKPKLLPEYIGKIPVFKNLLLWNHVLKTDTTGKVECSFYTPDNTGTFKIKCIGITREGLVGEGSTFITVREAK
jgi:hypothetical protein